MTASTFCEGLIPTRHLYKKGKTEMTETSDSKKKSISILQRLAILAVLGIALAVVFNYLR